MPCMASRGHSMILILPIKSNIDKNSEGIGSEVIGSEVMSFMSFITVKKTSVNSVNRYYG